MAKLVDVISPADIFPEYRDTPVESLFRYHNLGEPMLMPSMAPQMFIGMCMDHRKFLAVPNGFAYIMRTAGARLRGNEFELLYAIAVGGVSTVVLIGHTDCGMTRVLNQREAFIHGLDERAGVSIDAGAMLFDDNAPKYAISSPVDSVILQTNILRQHLSGILVAPLLYQVENDRLVQVVMDED